MICLFSYFDLITSLLLYLKNRGEAILLGLRSIYYAKNPILRIQNFKFCEDFKIGGGLFNAVSLTHTRKQQR